VTKKFQSPSLWRYNRVVTNKAFGHHLMIKPSWMVIKTLFNRHHQ